MPRKPRKRRLDPSVLADDSKPARLCRVKYCRNNRPVRGPRAEGKDASLYNRCARCKKEKWRREHPLQAAFCRIRDRARRKKIPFDLTLFQLAEVAIEAGYAPGSGLHLDRKDATLGYTKGNVQVLTGTENIIKGNKERWTEKYRAYFKANRLAHPEPLPDIPEGQDPF